MRTKWEEFIRCVWIDALCAELFWSMWPQRDNTIYRSVFHLKWCLCGLTALKPVIWRIVGAFHQCLIVTIRHGQEKQGFKLLTLYFVLAKLKQAMLSKAASDRSCSYTVGGCFYSLPLKTKPGSTYWADTSGSYTKWLEFWSPVLCMHHPLYRLLMCAAIWLRLS